MDGSDGDFRTSLPGSLEAELEELKKTLPAVPPETDPDDFTGAYFVAAPYGIKFDNRKGQVAVSFLVEMGYKDESMKLSNVTSVPVRVYILPFNGEG